MLFHKTSMLLCSITFKLRYSSVVLHHLSQLKQDYVQRLVCRLQNELLFRYNKDEIMFSSKI